VTSFAKRAKAGLTGWCFRLVKLAATCANCCEAVALAALLAGKPLTLRR
jgi:hypothetical protein